VNFATNFRWLIFTSHIFAKSKPLILDSTCVTIATYGPRIQQVHLVLKNVITQSLPVQKIYLVIDESDRIRTPESLKRFEKFGLEIVYIPDGLRSYKKFYGLQDSRFNLKIIYDDDLYISRKSVQRLFMMHRKYPDCIIGHRGVDVPMNENDSKPYKEWKRVSKRGVPSSTLLLTSGAGSLYSAKLTEIVQSTLDKDNFLTLCPTADDLWMFFSANRFDVKRVLTHSMDRFAIPFIFGETNGLWVENVILGGNDRQFKNLLDKYGLKRI
jgi:hypothetical protein